MFASTVILLALAGQPADTTTAPPTAPAADPAGIEFFEKRVRPILVERCFECHAASREQPGREPRGGLSVERREAILEGGDTGPAAVSGDPQQSLLVTAVRYQDPDLQMPPAGKMPEAEIAVLEDWIRRGLPQTPAEALTKVRSRLDVEEGRKHWAFQPLARSPLPSTETGDAPTRLDAWVRHRLEEHRLTPSPPASRRALRRRVQFELVGLPPTFEEVEAFVADETPDAWDRLVDQLLAAPQFGERWGRVWLDYTRYCDVPESWREGDARAWLYRDWVIQSWNADLPYDEFVRRQLAADLLPAAQPADVAALGFLGLSPTYWKELKLDHKVIKQVVAEEWEERIEALGATFLGLTIACARCHDHKFDPIGMRDYYALAGVFASSRLEDRPIIAEDQARVAAAARNQLKSIAKELQTLSGKPQLTPDESNKMQDLLRQKEVLEATPDLHTPLAFAVSEARIRVIPDGQHRTKIEYDAGVPCDVAMQIRGNAANPGPTVPRGFLTVLSRSSEPHFTHGSGRRELADAIVADAAPLATRVFVNRLWKQVFGRGLVTTPSNFGTQGTRPSHPELLDDLSARFQSAGWSPKRLLRELVLSATYQQSSYRDPVRYQIDPDNVWLWRTVPRRLEVEAWRDATLAATGELNLRSGGEPVELSDPANVRRTVYGRVKRRELADLLRLHDFPDPVAHSPARESTITPLQQLFALNSPWLQHRSQMLADRILAASSTVEDAERIKGLYRFVLARNPTEAEVRAGTEFLGECLQAGLNAPVSWQHYAQILLDSNEFQFVD